MIGRFLLCDPLAAYLPIQHGDWATAVARAAARAEAQAAAVMLGYNYNSSEWYEKSYKILNANYEPIKIKKDNEEGSLVKRTLKKILLIND